MTVVDGRSGKLVGNIAGIAGGTHGIAVSAATGQGFTDDGAAGVAIAFDLETLKIRQRIAARADADAVIADARSGHIFVIEGDPESITVVDPGTDKAVATIAVGETLEYAVSDDAGALYVAGKAKGDVVKIDTSTNAVVAHWPAADCRSPHGLAIDRARARLFVGCANSEMIVLDATDGRVIATLPIGTRASGRTMAIDPASGRLFVPAADLEPNPAPGTRPKAKPGSLRLLMFDPVP